MLRVVSQERHLGSLLFPLLQPLCHKNRRWDRRARLPLLVRGLDLRIIEIVNLNIIIIMTFHLVLIMFWYHLYNFLGFRLLLIGLIEMLPLRVTDHFVILAASMRSCGHNDHIWLIIGLIFCVSRVVVLMISRLASSNWRWWVHLKILLVVILIHWVHTLPKEGHLIRRQMLINVGSIYSMVDIASLHDHSNRKSLGLLDFISEGGSPAEYFPILLLLSVITMREAHICIRWLDDLHVALKASVIFPREIVIFEIAMHLVGAGGWLKFRLMSTTTTTTSYLLKVRVSVLLSPWLSLVRLLGREDVLFDFLKARHATLDNLW